MDESLENYLEKELLATRRLNERNQFAFGTARGALVDIPFPLHSLLGPCLLILGPCGMPGPAGGTAPVTALLWAPGRWWDLSHSKRLPGAWRALCSKPLRVGIKQGELAAPSWVPRDTGVQGADAFLRAVHTSTVPSTSPQAPTEILPEPCSPRRSSQP